MTLASITTSAPAFRAQHIAALFDGFRTVSIPITLPWSEILETLNRSQPDVLSLYPSLLPRLARQAVDGSLDIAPKLIVGGAEPLSKRHREVAARAWSCPVLNMWGAAETGLLAIGEGVDSGMLLREGEAIIEPVDCAGRPVADGRCADKVYVTPLFRRTLPLLRYELTDRILVRPQRCTTAPAFRWIDDIRGRLEDDFVYRGARVSADAFQGPLGAHPEILEYQVRQTRRGARILVTAENSLDTRRLARRHTRPDPAPTRLPCGGLGVAGGEHRAYRSGPQAPKLCADTVILETRFISADRLQSFYRPFSRGAIR